MRKLARKAAFFYRLGCAAFITAFLTGCTFEVSGYGNEPVKVSVYVFYGISILTGILSYVYAGYLKRCMKEKKEKRKRDMEKRRRMVRLAMEPLAETKKVSNQ